MRVALEQALQAYKRDEVPVGAVLTNSTDDIIVSGHNQPISSVDPTAHAEIVVIREAARQLNNYRLPDTTLYVTLEPCVMCVGAMLQARVGRIVFGALEPKTGAVQSVHQIFQSNRLNHYPEILGGVLGAECSALMSKFFQQKRQARKTG